MWEGGAPWWTDGRTVFNYFIVIAYNFSRDDDDNDDDDDDVFGYQNYESVSYSLAYDEVGRLSFN